MQTFLHGKIAWPLAAEWEILFPHGVICLSRSILNGLPSPASKSFLWISAIHTALILSLLQCQAALSRNLLCSLLNHSLLTYNYMSILCIWNTFHFQEAGNEWVVSAGQELSWCLQQTQHKFAPKDSFLPRGFQHSALPRPQDAGFSPQVLIFASTTALST